MDEVKGGVIPREFIQPINKGVQEALTAAWSPDSSSTWR